MNYVQEGLYIGTVDDAYNVDALQKNGVTHILTVVHQPLRKDVTDLFCYKFIHALDMESQDLLSHFEDAIAFIDEGRAAGGVLVHCYFGQSRSATLVLAYLMYKMSMPLDDALLMLMKQRPQIRPNPGFKEQLLLFESMGNQLDKQNEQYKLYRLNNLALQIQSAQLSDSKHVDSFSADPCHSQCSDSGDVMYKCKKCRRPLFKSSSKFNHTVGRGEAAFDWRSHLPTGGGLDEKDESFCEQSLFIEPVQWMGEDVLAIEGKITCPKCRAKLGSFNWAGERCPCGTWVTPAFHVQNSKVDECKIRAVQPLPSTPVPHQVHPIPHQMSSSSFSVSLTSSDVKMQPNRPVAKVAPMVQSTCIDPCEDGEELPSSQ